jgi:hypothetical protein
MKTKEFTKKASVGEHEAWVSEDELSGIFLFEGEAIGNLIFEGGHLTDYDGIFELPSQVIEALESMGFVVDEEFR